MKTLQSLFLIVSLIFSSTIAHSQKATDTFHATAQFSSNQDKIVAIHNINGSIEVEGYNGDEVIVEVTQSYSADTRELLAKAKEELSVEIVEDGNEVIIYFDTPRSHFDVKKRQYRSHQNNYRKPGYSNLFDFIVKVPFDASLEVSTMNSGEIEINNIRSNEINANNLNGPIHMKNIDATVYANALNKDINIAFSANPDEDSYFSSLNGDVNIQVQPNLNAHVFFKTLNGKIYADLPSSDIQNKLTKNASSERGTKFKINKSKQFVVGNGGTELHFDLLNGSVTISE